VIACGRNQERLSELASNSNQISTLRFDITDQESYDGALSTLSPDVTILNAGSCEYVDIENFESDMFKRVFESNVFGAVHCLQALLPNLKPGSKVILVDSLARLLPFTKSQAYGASKAALHYMGQTFLVDLPEKGVTVQTVSPGLVETPLTDQNDFKMPMVISADQAAKAVLKAVTSNRPSTHFPFVFSSLLRGLSMLPASMKIGIGRHLAKANS